ncbi:MAG TPA: pilus assembly PilX N-terminal domain-containing protein [Thermoanaerobaculia bacterium]|nr:pilus assembly PilX N-terminal domain-containing protein [Thermoanaerobaculia bacterium]
MSTKMVVGRPAERGSAYLVALLGLVILTVLGLTLSLITQTEMRMGANERVLQRVFYAADSGFGTSLSRAMVQGDFSGRTITLPDPSSPPAFALRHTVAVTPLVPVLSAPCNLCQINNTGTYGAKQYHKVSHAVGVDAQRVGGDVANPGLVAQKALSAMLDVQPMESTPNAHLVIEDAEQMARVRF